MEDKVILNTKPYISPLKTGKSEFEVKKSVFIFYCVPAKSESEVKDSFLDIKKKHPDGKHHVYAWSIRDKAILKKHSDDREPSGSAGLPISAILSSRCIDNVIVVVVRYFGGILLGKGGLVKAYTRAALDSLNESDLKMFKPYSRLSGFSGYGEFDNIKRYCNTTRCKFVDEKYGENISFEILTPIQETEIIKSGISDITSGRVFLKFEANEFIPEGEVIKI